MSDFVADLKLFCYLNVSVASSFEISGFPHLNR